MPLLPLLLAVTFAPPVARAAADSTTVRVKPGDAIRRLRLGLQRPDRLQHVSLGLSIGVAAGIASREPAAALAAPVSLGLVKELADTRGPGFDAVDLLAGIAGGAAAGWITARRFR